MVRGGDGYGFTRIPESQNPEGAGARSGMGIIVEDSGIIWDNCTGILVKPLLHALKLQAPSRPAPSQHLRGFGILEFWNSGKASLI